MRPLSIGIIGYGAIGHDLFQAIEAGHAGSAVCPAVLVHRARTDGTVPQAVISDPDRFFAQPFDAVIECAGHDGLRQHGDTVLCHGADLLVTSVGALTDDALRIALIKTAEANGKKLILPSAGIGALDMLSAAAVGGLTRVVVEVRKDPVSWKGTIAETMVDLDTLSSATVLYEGPVREGARRYPANVNISAAAAFAGLGLDQTALRIVADPAITTHVVRLEAEGAFGKMQFQEDVIPSDSNPKTGKIVAMALIKTVRHMSSAFVVGA